MYRYFSPFPCDYVATLDKDTFDFINNQASKMPAEHWIMIAEFLHEMFFEDFLLCKMYHFLKKLYKQMMPAKLLSHPIVCGFYTINAAFHLFKFC